MKKFINRTKELNEINQHLIDEAVPVFLHGPGGIGKTRLLQEIRRRYEEDHHYKIFWLDFDNYRELLLPHRIELVLAKQVNEEIDHRVEQAVFRYGQMSRRSDSLQTLNEQRQQIEKALVKGIEASSAKVLFVLDTVEKLDDGGKWAVDELINIIQSLPSARCIFSGRKQKNRGQPVHIWTELREKLEQQVPPHTITLQPFSPQATEEYLQAKQAEIYINLSEAHKEALSLLTRGLPILLDLAVELVARKIDLPFLRGVNKKSFAQLSLSQQQEACANFERTLVDYLQRLEQPLDRLVTLMAHVYPIGSEDIPHFLMTVSPEEVDELVKNVRKLVFVKTLPNGRLTLHDEMRRMVRQYVWQVIDPQKEERKEYSRIAAKIGRERDQALYQEIKRLEETLNGRFTSDTNLLLSESDRQRIELEIDRLARQREAVTEWWIFHAGFADPQNTFDELSQLIDRIRRGRKFTLTGHLLNHTKRWESALKDEQKLELEFLTARLQMDLKQFSEAKRLFVDLLPRYAHRESDILNLLGVIETNLGNFQRALEYEQACLELLWGDQHPTDLDSITIDKLESIMYVSNWTGYVCRLLEDEDASYLEKAVKHYQQAIEIGVHLLSLPVFDQEKLTSTRSLVASALNNQGYVYGLQGNRRKAYLRCTAAIEIWEDIGHNREIAFALIALGILARDEGNYTESITYLQGAIRLLREPDDAEYLCRAWFHLGWSRWFLAEKDESPDHIVLELAMQDLNRARQYGEKHQIRRELPGIYHQLATVMWRTGGLKKDTALKAQARELNQQAIQVSRELHNLRYLIDSIVGEAEFDWDDGNSNRLSDLLSQLAEYEQHTTFPLYFGRMQRIQGDFALKAKNIELAIDFYGDGFKQMNQHGGYGPYAIERELLRFARHLEIFVTNEQALEILSSLQKQWSMQQSPGEKVDLSDWCRQQIIHFRLFRGAKQ